MKNAAVNATTAIADGVSSLLGGSKVKRLEAENENLRQDIAYRPDRTQKEEVGKTGEEINVSCTVTACGIIFIISET